MRLLLIALLFAALPRVVSAQNIRDVEYAAPGGTGLKLDAYVPAPQGTRSQS